MPALLCSGCSKCQNRILRGEREVAMRGGKRVSQEDLASSTPQLSGKTANGAARNKTRGSATRVSDKRPPSPSNGAIGNNKQEQGLRERVTEQVSDRLTD
jgi:hypothetical protein